MHFKMKCFCVSTYHFLQKLLNNGVFNHRAKILLFFCFVSKSANSLWINFWRYHFWSDDLLTKNMESNCICWPVYMCLCLLFFRLLCLSVFLPVFLSTCFVNLSVCLCLYNLYVCPSYCLSHCLICMPFYLFICLRVLVYLSVCLSTCISVCQCFHIFLSACLSSSLST